MTIAEQSELLEFPCDYLFKAFCDREAVATFRQAIKQAVNNVMPCSDDAIKERQSAKGNYSCVTALVLLQNRQQLEAINAEIRKINTLMFMI